MVNHYPIVFSLICSAWLSSTQPDLSKGKTPLFLSSMLQYKLQPEYNLRVLMMFLGILNLKINEQNNWSSDSSIQPFGKHTSSKSHTCFGIIGLLVLWAISKQLLPQNVKRQLQRVSQMKANDKRNTKV